MHLLYRRTFAWLCLSLFALTLSSCQQERAETPNRTPSPEQPVGGTDSAAPLAQQPPVQPGNGSHGFGTPGNHQSAWSRKEVSDTVDHFLRAIDSKNQERFWGMLTQRSLDDAANGFPASRDEIWSAAQESFEQFEQRQVRVLGGSRDSVAVQVERVHVTKRDSVGSDGIAADTLSDPVIVQMRRENGRWRVKYPGLVYPERDERR